MTKTPAGSNSAFCIAHPRRAGRAQCVRCGAWLCRQCSRGAPEGRVCKDAASCETRCRAQIASGRKRLLHNVLWPLLGILCAAFAAFPLSIRTALDSARRVEHLEYRQRILQGELADHDAQRRQLARELRMVKDSIGAVIDSLKAFAALSRRHDALLGFDRRLPVSFDNGSRALKYVCLTFDGDAHSNATRDILDTLASRNVPATMFLTGQFIQRHPGLVLSMLRAGHEIGSHTYSHPHLTSWAQDRSHTTLPSITRATMFNELGRTERVFRKLTGTDITPLWRAPYGERNREICLWAQEAGYLHVGWRQGRTWRENLDTNDWVPDENTPGYFTPREVLRKIIDAAREKPHGINGGIILLHLGTLRRQRSQQVHLSIGTLIDSLRALDYELVTVSRLAERSGVDLSLLRPAAAVSAAPPRQSP